MVQSMSTTEILPAPRPRPHVPTEEVVCPVCRRSESMLAARGPDYDCHSCGDQEFSLVQCNQCRTYYLNPRPTTAALPQIYSPDEYYSYDFAEKGNAMVLKARLARDRQKVAEIVSALGKSPAEVTLLDIGAGDGLLLEAFRSAGTPAGQLHGTELDERAVMNIAKRGFHGILKRAEELDYPAETFNAVTMIQVIEHVGEPMRLVQRLAAMMAKGAVLFLETPNMKAWDRAFFRTRLWGGYYFPRHWTLWDPETMTHMLDESGFDVLSITTPPAAVVWVWSINHLMQAWFGDGRLARFFSMNNPFALAPFWLLELLPGKLGRSANMRIVARRR